MTAVSYVVIVAGGKGLRMGGEIPKQFLPVEGTPILMRTIRAFRSALPNIRIILVLPHDQHAYWDALCQQHNFHEPLLIAEGGETRFHSVRNGLAMIPEDAEGVVGVHDGVRPFVSCDTIVRCYDTAKSTGTAVPVTPVVETIREMLPDGGSRTMNREDYRLVQTPQTFRVNLLKEAYKKSYSPFFTDDASVVEASGIGITLVEGNRENIKITTPSDLLYAESLCRT